VIDPPYDVSQSLDAADHILSMEKHLPPTARSRR
jgi:hypothetical protein